MATTKRRVHRAFVEEVLALDGTCWVYRATCLTTRTVCDAYAWASIVGDTEAMQRAVEYLSSTVLHEPDSAAFCPAEHVL